MPRDYDNDDDDFTYPDSIEDIPVDDEDFDDDTEYRDDDEWEAEPYGDDENEDDIADLFDEDGDVSERGYLVLAEMDRNGLFA
jgi:hypothetical protein